MRHAFQTSKGWRKWTGHVACTVEERNSYKVLMRKPRHRSKDNIKTDPEETGWQGMECTDLAQDRDKHGLV
jgi:hypothetical protein